MGRGVGDPAYFDARARATRAVETMLASGLPAVSAYRDRYLGNAPLTRTQARAFLNDPKRGQREAHEGPGRPYNVLTYVDPDDGRGGAESFVSVQAGTPLDVLREPAFAIESKFAWPAAEAVWFILTGEVPPPDPLIVGRRVFRSDAVGRVVLSIAPWVPGELVAMAYRKAQRERTNGVPPRPIGIDKLELAIFLAERFTDQHRPTWRELMADWNATHPAKWAYSSMNAMQRDWLRVRRMLTPPPTTWPT